MAESIAAQRAAMRAEMVAHIEKNAGPSAVGPKPEEGEEVETMEVEPAEASEETEEAEPAAEEGEEVEASEKEDEPAPAKEEAKPEPKLAKGFADLAKRDAESRKAHQARLAELKAYETQLTQRATQAAEESRKQILADLTQRAMRDPVGFFRELGVQKGFKDIAAQFYYEELGADAPPEVRGQKQLYGVQAQVNEIRRSLDEQRVQLEAERQQLAQERMIGEFRSSLGAALPKAAAPHQYLSNLAKYDPAQATDFMIAAANEYARTNPTEPPASAEQLAEMVEKALEQRLKPFAGVLPKKTSPIADESEPATTLTSNHSGRTPAKTKPKSRDELRAEVQRELESRQGRSE